LGSGTYSTYLPRQKRPPHRTPRPHCVLEEIKPPSPNCGGSVEQQQRDLADLDQPKRTRIINRSDYHTGFAVILTATQPGQNLAATNQPFAQSPAFTWLSTNAHRFGFELSFAEDHEYYEPRRWRYVGDGSIFQP